MRRKSTSAFVFGIIGTSLAGLMMVSVLWILALIMGIASALNGVSAILYDASIFMYFVAVIVGIVGCVFVKKNARIGGIILIVSTILGALVPIVYTIDMVNGGSLSVTLIGLLYAPTILTLVGGVCGVLSKLTPEETEEQKHDNEYNTLGKIVKRKEEEKQDDETIMIECPHCSAKMALGNAFCPSCGGKWEDTPATKANVCPECGAKLKKSDKFCTKCGHEIK